MTKLLRVIECGCSVESFKGGYVGEVRIPRVDCKHRHEKGQRLWIRKKKVWKKGQKPRRDLRVR